MNITLTLAGALLVAGALLAPTGSSTDFCNGNGTIIRIGVGNVNAAYVAVDSVFGGFLFSVWIYAETNGVPDLQRGGVTLFGDADICQDYVNHDQGIF